MSRQRCAVGDRDPPPHGEPRPAGRGHRQIGRRRQVVRQGSAKPSSPVQIRSSPLSCTRCGATLRPGAAPGWRNGRRKGLKIPLRIADCEFKSRPRYSVISTGYRDRVAPRTCQYAGPWDTVGTLAPNSSQQIPTPHSACGLGTRSEVVPVAIVVLARPPVAIGPKTKRPVGVAKPSRTPARV